MDTRKLQLFKTELCRNWQEMGHCRYAKKCRFAHGEEELRGVRRHAKYKTEICKTFHLTGTCSYGVRCTFIHDEVPLTPSLFSKEDFNTWKNNKVDLSSIWSSPLFDRRSSSASSSTTTTASSSLLNISFI